MDADETREGAEVPTTARNAVAHSLSAGSARRQLGTRLRDIRMQTGLKLARAAKAIERSSATLSRLERGEAKPRLVDINALLEHYGEHRDDLVTDAVRASVLELVRDSRRDEWFDEYRDVLGSTLTSAELQRFVELEVDAREYRSFEDALVPGLLQTPAYAAAVAETFLKDRTPAERRRFVEFRMARQRVLDHLRLHVVISEAALRRPPGTAQVMVEQLEMLIEELRNGREHVTIQIAPLTLVSPTVTRGPFVVIHFRGDEPSLVYLESRAGASYLRGAAVDQYESEFARLVGDALDREGSLMLLKEVVATFR